MKIFITGGSGLLGQYLNIELSKKHEILTQYRTAEGNCKKYNSVKLSITEYDKIENIFTSFNPDVVIHAAAVSSPETADKLSAKDVFEINVNSTRRLAGFCEKYKSRLFYISTDLVYAGYRGSILSEDSKLVPISIYAETKLMGEVKIEETFDNYVILREALLIGFGLNHSRNNFQMMYENLKNGKPVKLFTDQFRSPLSLTDSARIIGELIDKDVRKEIFNLGGRDRVSRSEIGEIVCDKTGFDKNLIIKTTMDEVGMPYNVKDVSLSIEKLNSFDIKPLSLYDSIQKIIESYGQ